MAVEEDWGNDLWLLRGDEWVKVAQAEARVNRAKKIPADAGRGAECWFIVEPGSIQAESDPLGKMKKTTD